MTRITFTVVFFCKKTKVTKKGKAPIYARVTTSGRSTEIYTQCQIEPERWNQRLERSLYKDEIDMQINRIVASYRANILAAYDQLLKEGKEPNCFAIKHRLENPTGNARLFLAEFSKYCDRRQKGRSRGCRTPASGASRGGRQRPTVDSQEYCWR